MTSLAQLKAARTLITDESHWTQFVAARDRRNRGTWPHDPKACCFCLTGALAHVAGERGLYVGAVWQIARSLGYARNDGTFQRSVVEDFNDTHTHVEVLALLDRTIAGLEVAA